MNRRVRTIEVDERTALLLEARAVARGLSMSELLADLADASAPLPGPLEDLRRTRSGPWSPDVLADDERRLAEFQTLREGVPWEEMRAWVTSWGAVDERPAPVPRRV